MRDDIKFKEVSTEKERKLKYEGFCDKCDKVTYQRLTGGNIYKTRYKCMKCKTTNEVNDVH